MESRVRVGPAGWSYEDWKGIVYPAKAGGKFDQLAYLSQFFDTIEINSTFYRPPAPSAAKSWARRVAHNADFKFTAKLYRVFTHERGKAAAEDEEAYRKGVSPLLEAERLGAVLVQFPWSFKNDQESRDYLAGLLDRFKDYPLVLEVRHGSWNKPSVYKSLESRDVGFCNIDQPLFARSIEPSARTTSKVGYVRLHGRNYENWFSETSDAAERYDYLYTTQELQPWLENIKAVAESAAETYVITNNHFQGKAAANALEIKSQLKGEKVAAPESLIEQYPKLRESAFAI
ncbi:MAG TPA: DUF72 domain-containing protein [Blastocatellia bacterium]|nr:DUF72 domain-containing protein [Blastocatellia bacterium]